MFLLLLTMKYKTEQLNSTMCNSLPFARVIKITKVDSSKNWEKQIFTKEEKVCCY